jgi:hypothetical protein
VDITISVSLWTCGCDTPFISSQISKSKLEHQVDLPSEIVSVARAWRTGTTHVRSCFEEPAPPSCD